MSKHNLNQKRGFLRPALWAVALAGVLCACVGASEAEPHRRYLDNMDTFITLTAYGDGAEAALDLAQAEIGRLDDLLSTGLADSEITRLNQEGSMEVSEDTAAIVEKALSLYDSTKGLFDITIYPLMQLWGFAHSADAVYGGPDAETGYHVPTTEELDQVLALVGSDRIGFDETTRRVTLDEGQSIDLGGIAKGFTSQRIMEVYRQAGLTSGMVSLGGNVQCLGHKPDGSDYVIAIRNPYDTTADYIATMQLHDAAVITSGGYERYFTDEATGTVYQHIMDPRTGFPAVSDLASVTIVTSDGMLGDGLSTSLYIMGLDGAIEYWRKHHSEFQMLLADLEGTLYVSEGLADRVLTPDEFVTVEQ